MGYFPSRKEAFCEAAEPGVFGLLECVHLWKAEWNLPIDVSFVGITILREEVLSGSQQVSLGACFLPLQRCARGRSDLTMSPKQSVKRIKIGGKWCLD